MMREQDGRNTDGASKQMARERFSQVMYPDGLFAWQFHYDFHRTGRTYLREEGTSGPWIDYEKPGRHTHHVSDRSLFPLRSLVPEEMDGLLGAQKNVGYSSIVCAAIRLHDQCIAIGQAAGATAAISLKENISPLTIPYDRARLEQVRDALCGDSEKAVPLLIWPFRDLPADHKAFVAVNRLAARGGLPLDVRDVDFKPDESVTSEWCNQVVGLSLQTKMRPLELTLPRPEMTRGSFCIWLWDSIREQPDVRFVRSSPQDADGDGIPDRNDPSLFTSAEPIRWSVAAALPEQDGLPNDFLVDEVGVRYFNFTGRGSKSITGFANDFGLPFDITTGHGWDHDISADNRRRNVYAEAQRDTFLFTRSAAQWECVVPNGRWSVTICVGDSGHDQLGHRVTIEGQEVIRDEATPSGQFIERSAVVDIRDGRVMIALGPQLPGNNTCMNWVRLQSL